MSKRGHNKIGARGLVKNAAMPFLKRFQTNSGDDVEGVWKFGVYEQEFHSCVLMLVVL
jgi:hypothetical protein